jgi:hypothetical protein
MRWQHAGKNLKMIALQALPLIFLITDLHFSITPAPKSSYAWSIKLLASIKYEQVIVERKVRYQSFVTNFILFLQELAEILIKGRKGFCSKTIPRDLERIIP